MHWTYGLVEDRGKLILCEIYFDKKYDISFTFPLTWKDIVKYEYKKMIIKDLRGQFANADCHFRLSKTNRNSKKNKKN